MKFRKEFSGRTIGAEAKRRRTFGRSKEEVGAASIAKELVRVLARVETFIGDLEILMDTAQLYITDAKLTPGCSLSQLCEIGAAVRALRGVYLGDRDELAEVMDAKMKEARP